MGSFIINHWHSTRRPWGFLESPNLFYRPSSALSWVRRARVQACSSGIDKDTSAAPACPCLVDQGSQWQGASSSPICLALPLKARSRECVRWWNCLCVYMTIGMCPPSHIICQAEGHRGEKEECPEVATPPQGKKQTFPSRITEVLFLCFFWAEVLSRELGSCSTFFGGGHRRCSCSNFPSKQKKSGQPYSLFCLQSRHSSQQKNMKAMTDQYTHELSDYGNLNGYCHAGMLNSTVQWQLFRESV